MEALYRSSSYHEFELAVLVDWKIQNLEALEHQTQVKWVSESPSSSQDWFPPKVPGAQLENYTSFKFIDISYKEETWSMPPRHFR